MSTPSTVVPSTGTAPLEERVRAELQLIRSTVTGVHGSLVATSDGFLVTHDMPDLEPTEVAALVATTRALASRTTNSTGRGEFREAMARGSLGYLAVYAAGSNAIVAVVGTNELNIGMLHLQTRAIVERIAANSPEFRKWGAGGRSSGAPAAAAAATTGQPAPAPAALPRRRPAPR